MVFRFKIWFENDDEIVRWIDIKPASSFLDFHHAIQDAIGFDKKELASFYISDIQWKKHMEITLENMLDDEDMNSDTALPSPVMKDTKLRDWINDPHQRFIYISDYVAQWTLLIELQSIQDPRKDATYPLLVKSEGKAPRQREDSKFKMLDDNEFDALAAKILAAKGIKDELLLEAEELLDEDDDQDEDDGNDFYGDSTEEFGMDGFSEVND